MNYCPLTETSSGKIIPGSSVSNMLKKKKKKDWNVLFVVAMVQKEEFNLLQTIHSCLLILLLLCLSSKHSKVISNTQQNQIPIDFLSSELLFVSLFLWVIAICLALYLSTVGYNYILAAVRSTE